MLSVGGLLFYEEAIQWEVDLVERGEGRGLGGVKGGETCQNILYERRINSQLKKYKMKIKV